MSLFMDQHSPSLQIQVLEHRGHRQQIVWHWPTQAEGMVTLAEVLQDMPDMDACTLKQAHACKIEMLNGPALPVWYLTNASSEFACMHNGAQLPAAQSVRLSSGDDVEFGFTHFVVVLAEAEPGRQHAFCIDDPQTGLNGAIRNGSDYSMPRTRSGPTQQPQYLSPTDSAQACEAALAELVNTQQKSGALFASSDGDQLAAIHPAVTQEYEFQSALATKSDGLPEEVDPLDHLHEQYLARLRNSNPGNTGHTETWQEYRADQRRSHEDEFALLRERGGTGAVHELLSGVENTDDLLAGFDQLNDVNVLAPETFGCVMHLFAPAELKATESTVAQAILPELTRLEHHGMAIDSDMTCLTVMKNTDNPERQ